MTDRELIEKALYSSATIHQPHSLKAYLSAKHLYERFSKDENIWAKTGELIDQSELRVTAVLSESVLTPKLSDFRIQRVLERGIYPAAYQAMCQWHETKGFKDIFSYYVKDASSTREYLSHNVTILLALNCVYAELESKQIPAFLDRFTEFVTSTFSKNDARKGESGVVDVDKVLGSCLSQFGFFGHNLITLAWVLRCKDSLSESQYGSMLSNLYLQANSPLEDPDDEININIWEQCLDSYSSEAFVNTAKALVYNYTSNLHQVTLADAVCFLQSTFPEQTGELGRIVEYHCRLLEK
ncbi:TPA: hypothetical protein ACX3DO_004496 [Vibrio parahaemolyticus]|uniref:hypothetical protein n=1 Tax=Vibrio anguillarum TaxID=55601 RepID=UPI00186A7005|nr:hypothetical protein [Vibrio anguillarum]ELI5413123.1 hypothetical protein [Vibrio parahaemolyticus]MBE4323120.1 hypothetical protein [Vibrio parahaemolyticus]MBE4341276.1 hypothetical protein [Vibrio parahaemolyticus]MBT2949665.1 hypothetical protein [Vibrio anguillarum]